MTQAAPGFGRFGPTRAATHAHGGADRLGAVWHAFAPQWAPLAARHAFLNFATWAVSRRGRDAVKQSES